MSAALRCQIKGLNRYFITLKVLNALQQTDQMFIKLRPTSVQPKSIMANLLLVKQFLEKAHLADCANTSEWWITYNIMHFKLLSAVPLLVLQHPGATTNKVNTKYHLVPLHVKGLSALAFQTSRAFQEKIGDWLTKSQTSVFRMCSIMHTTIKPAPLPRPF